MRKIFFLIFCIANAVQINCFPNYLQNRNSLAHLDDSYYFVDSGVNDMRKLSAQLKNENIPTTDSEHALSYLDDSFYFVDPVNDIRQLNAQSKNINKEQTESVTVSPYMDDSYYFADPEPTRKVEDSSLSVTLTEKKENEIELKENQNLNNKPAQSPAESESTLKLETESLGDTKPVLNGQILDEKENIATKEEEKNVPLETLTDSVDLKSQKSNSENQENPLRVIEPTNTSAKEEEENVPLETSTNSVDLKSQKSNSDQEKVQENRLKKVEPTTMRIFNEIHDTIRYLHDKGTPLEGRERNEIAEQMVNLQGFYRSLEKINEDLKNLELTEHEKIFNLKAQKSNDNEKNSFTNEKQIILDNFDETVEKTEKYIKKVSENLSNKENTLNQKQNIFDDPSLQQIYESSLKGEASNLNIKLKNFLIEKKKFDRLVKHLNDQYEYALKKKQMYEALIHAIKEKLGSSLNVDNFQKTQIDLLQQEEFFLKEQQDKNENIKEQLSEALQQQQMYNSIIADAFDKQQLQQDEIIKYPFEEDSESNSFIQKEKLLLQQIDHMADRVFDDIHETIRFLHIKGLPLRGEPRARIAAKLVELQDLYRNVESIYENIRNFIKGGKENIYTLKADKSNISQKQSNIEDLIDYFSNVVKKADIFIETAKSLPNEVSSNKDKKEALITKENFTAKEQEKEEETQAEKVIDSVNLKTQMSNSVKNQEQKEKIEPTNLLTKEQEENVSLETLTNSVDLKSQESNLNKEQEQEDRVKKVESTTMRVFNEIHDAVRYLHDKGTPLEGRERNEIADKMVNLQGFYRSLEKINEDLKNLELKEHEKIFNLKAQKSNDNDSSTNEKQIILDNFDETVENTEKYIKKVIHQDTKNLSMKENQKQNNLDEALMQKDPFTNLNSFKQLSHLDTQTFSSEIKTEQTESDLIQQDLLNLKSLIKKKENSAILNQEKKTPAFTEEEQVPKTFIKKEIIENLVHKQENFPDQTKQISKDLDQKNKNFDGSINSIVQKSKSFDKEKEEQRIKRISPIADGVLDDIHEAIKYLHNKGTLAKDAKKRHEIINEINNLQNLYRKVEPIFENFKESLNSDKEKVNQLRAIKSKDIIKQLKSNEQNPLLDYFDNLVQDAKNSIKHAYEV